MAIWLEAIMGFLMMVNTQVTTVRTARKIAAQNLYACHRMKYEGAPIHGLRL